MEKLKRIYHPYNEWEELLHNMWGEIPFSQKKDFLKRTIIFMSNHSHFGKYMQRVSREWVKSSEHNLTDYSMNRKSWLGRAACALALKVPENIVREAWGFLTDEQRELANIEADKVIKNWEDLQCQK